MRSHKTLLIVAAVLVVLGVSICGISFAVLGFDWKALNSANLVTNEYTVSKHFENISVRGDTEGIVFAPSEDGKCRVVCCEDEKELHSVRVESKTLLIDRSGVRSWHFGFFFGRPSVTVYLPEETYGALSVDAHTGDVMVPKEFSFESIDIKLTTGDIALSASAAGPVTLQTGTGSIGLSDMTAETVTLSSGTGRTRVNNVKCADLYSVGDTGDLNLSRVIASGEIRIQRSTGDVRFEECDAASVAVKTSTGDVRGTLLTDKVFLTETSTGSVHVPKTVTGGRCEISTGTGDIHISVP